ncbi:MAG: isocitrate lyase/PEP mutase family protein [Rhodospirillales bacterium]|jgi:carboxyvinyl-carboxyphosphonate phosphorylmutase|nr:isocitrate lyase/PEP mutase family protein [Rhodospirillales bacterium]
MDWKNRREIFRKILHGEKLMHPATVFDPISARVAQDLGYETCLLPGSVASMTVLGAPDIMQLTLTEFAGQALRISRASHLPMLVDADHGYGNALNVKRTVEELECAGIAALTIEDTDLPQPFGMVGQPRLIPMDEAIGKMRAGLEGRQDKNLVVVGRTAAKLAPDLADAVARAKAYEAAGVDALFLAGLDTREQLDGVSDAISIPIIAGSSSPELFNHDYLQSRGVRICPQPHKSFMASVAAIQKTLKAMRDGGEPAELASPDLMKQVTRGADYDRWTDEFLGGKG